MRKLLKPFDSRKVQSWLKSNAYKELINVLVSINEEKKIIADLAARLQINRDTIYRWINHEYTKKMIDDHISALSMRDRVILYENLRERRHDPRMARIWYDIYWPEFIRLYSTIKVFINFLEKRSQKRLRMLILP